MGLSIDYTSRGCLWLVSQHSDHTNTAPVLGLALKAAGGIGSCLAQDHSSHGMNSSPAGRVQKLTPLPLSHVSLVVPPCQDQEKALDKYDAVVRSLQERSQHVLPLRHRRQPPPQPVPVEALCEYEGEQVPARRGLLGGARARGDTR